jgi:hypothetical protein
LHFAEVIAQGLDLPLPKGPKGEAARSAGEGAAQ